MAYELTSSDRIVLEFTLFGERFQIFSRYNGTKGVLVNGMLMHCNKFSAFFDNGLSPDQVAREVKIRVQNAVKEQQEKQQGVLFEIND